MVFEVGIAYYIWASMCVLENASSRILAYITVIVFFTRRLFSDISSTPSPPSNIISPHLLSLDRHPEDIKATSLPNMFTKETNGGSRPSILGSGPLLTRKPLPSWKYSRLKLNSLGIISVIEGIKTLWRRFCAPTSYVVFN